MSAVSEKMVCIERERTPPKPVDMTESGHLERFKRAFESAATQMNLPLIKTTIEIFSADWDDFVLHGEISAEEVALAQKAVSAQTQTVVDKSAQSSSSTSSSSLATSTSTTSTSGTQSTKKDLKKGNLASLLASLPDSDDEKVPAPTKQKCLSEFAMRRLGITPAEEKKHNPLKRFWELRQGRVESVADWRGRVLLWEWFKACLRGSGPQPGKWFYIVAQVSEYDVAKLFRTLIGYIDVPNIMTHGLQGKALFDMQIKPGEDVFLYCNRLDEQVERVESANFNCQEESHKIHVPVWLLRWKILEAAATKPEFKFLLDTMRLEPPAKWMNLSKEELITTLRTTAQNTRLMEPVPGETGDNPVQDNVAVANAAVAFNVPGRGGRSRDRVCFKFRDSGKCDRRNCKFDHPSGRSESRSVSRGGDSESGSDSEENFTAGRHRGPNPQQRESLAGRRNSPNPGGDRGRRKQATSDWENGSVATNTRKYDNKNNDKNYDKSYDKKGGSDPRRHGRAKLARAVPNDYRVAKVVAVDYNWDRYYGERGYDHGPPVDGAVAVSQ